MNEYILKVMVWLKDKSFYSAEVMEENAYAADAAALVSSTDVDAYAADAAYAAAGICYAVVEAPSWVNGFFDRHNHDRSEYDAEVKLRLNNEDNPMIIEMGGKRYKLVEVK